MRALVGWVWFVGQKRNHNLGQSMAVLLALLLSACGGGGGDSGGSGGVTASAVSVSVTNPKEFTFSWAPVSGATYYKLLKNPDGVSGYTQVGSNFTGTTVTDTVSVHLHDWINARYIVESCTPTACTALPAVTTTSSMLSAVGYFKASNPQTNDLFGFSIALSADGNTLAVGAFSEDSAATGIDGNQADNAAPDAGAVYVFIRSGAVWAQQAYIKASNAGAGDYFGTSLSLSADGSTLAVGANLEDSTATGISGNQIDNSASAAGAVYVFTRSGSSWSQQSYIKASNTGIGDQFGQSVSLSADGSTLAVGAMVERSAATGIDGDQTDNSAGNAGAVYVFTRSSSVWSQQAYIKASNTGADDYFGYGVVLSADGNTLAVRADGEASAATGINGNQADNSAPSSGAIYIFIRGGGVWSQQAYVKASNAETGDSFEASIALSADGNTLAVGAFGEDSAATGIGGAQTDNSASNAGAVYVYIRSGTNWSQQAYIKPSNTGVDDYFGSAVALSSDGNTLAIGAKSEDGSAKGINGNQLDNSQAGSGAAYIFSRNGSAWSQKSYIKAANTEAGDGFGRALSLSADGNTLAVGSSGEDSAATGINGNPIDNSASASGAVYLY